MPFDAQPCKHPTVNNVMPSSAEMTKRRKGERTDWVTSRGHHVLLSLPSNIGNIKSTTPSSTAFCCTSSIDC